MNKTETAKIQKLMEKIGDGGTVTISDLESLVGTKVCSPKVALAKAKRGIDLTDAELKELAKDYKLAVEYASLKNEAFPESEPAILKSRDYRTIQRYFTEILPKPNKLYENWLLMDGGYRQAENILQYCKDILKARWPEGEKVLLRSYYRECLEIQKHFRIGRWPELEKVIFGKKGIEVEVRRKYFKNCGSGRNPEMEDLLLKKGKGLSIYLYATQCVHGKLVAPLHAKMILMGGRWSKKYISWLERKKKSVDLYLTSIGDISPETP